MLLKSNNKKMSFLYQTLEMVVLYSNKRMRVKSNDSTDWHFSSSCHFVATIKYSVQPYKTNNFVDIYTLTNVYLIEKRTDFCHDDPRRFLDKN